MSYQHVGTWEYFYGKKSVECITPFHECLLLQRFGDELNMIIGVYLDENALNEIGKTSDHCWFKYLDLSGSAPLADAFVPIENVYAYARTTFPRLIDIHQEEEE